MNLHPKKNQIEYMREVIRLSIENVRSGKGGPFAALVVKNDTILSRGTNLVTTLNDCTAHAEIIAIREACKMLRSFRLDNCDIYASCEPCPMCLGAIYWARPSRIFFAATRGDAAKAGFDDSLIYGELVKPADQRKIPTVQLLHDESLAVFDEWRKNKDKLEY
jgi:guanine deaminase